MSNVSKEQLQEWMKKEGEKLYGRILDEARVSSMTDRSYRQFEIDIKKYVRECMDGIVSVLSTMNDDKGE